MTAPRFTVAELRRVLDQWPDPDAEVVIGYEGILASVTAVAVADQRWMDRNGALVLAESLPDYTDPVYATVTALWP